MARNINKAILKLNKRAEKYDQSHIISSFVDIGPLLSLLEGTDHQVLYGRRGTGKTHALRYLESGKVEQGHCAVYIDMRTIGTTGGLYADPNITIAERGTRLLVDTLSVLHDAILDYSLSDDNKVNLAAVGPILDKFNAGISGVSLVADSVESQTSSGSTNANQSSSSFNVSLAKGLDVGLSEGEATENSNSRNKTVTGKEVHRVQFSSVHRDLVDLSRAIEAEVWIIIDEWSEVPLDLQPYLADLIRKTLLPVQPVTVKIGAIAQRTNFRSFTDGQSYGFEVGADVPSSSNLDEYMIFEHDKEKSKAFFRNLIYQHIREPVARLTLIWICRK